MAFSGSFITKEITESTGIFRVDSEVGQRLSGQNRSGDYSGIVFPYRYPGQDEVREYRLRRDCPDLEQGRGGLKEVRKYLCPPGRGNMIFFPPGCQPESLSDVSLPIVFTEGEKKTLALDRVAWCGLGDSTEKPKFLVLGLSGVWNFRGTVAKAPDANGQRRDVKGLIPDFHLLELKGRKLTILYDANVKTNDSVRRARTQLAKEMRALGARVHLADSPEIPGCNGIDDVLGRWEQDADADVAVTRCLALLDNASEFGEEQTSQADKLLALVEGMDLFHTPQNEPFAAVEINGHLEYHSLTSESFRRYLAHQYYKTERKVPGSQAIYDSINAFSGEAIFDGSMHEVYIRIASYEEKIYIDMCNDRWQIIEASKDGWKILESAAAPVRFRRNSAMRPLPMPYRSGGDVGKLGNFLNVDDENLVLLLSWLINTFRPGYPFPVLILSGEHGTAKSTTSRLLRELIDPSEMPLRSTPRNEHDFVIAAVRSWVICLDNLSIIPDWFSDALCRLATGGGFGARKLYSDQDETVLNVKRPVIINGIGSLANRSDLLDRALIVKLDPIPKEKRKLEKEFWAEFGRDKVSIFTGLLDAVVCGLQNLENVRLKELPRMADFTQWVSACEPALGLTEGSFLEIYNQNRDSVHSIVLEGSILAEVIQEFCVEKESGNNFKETFLFKELLTALKAKAGESRSNDKGFPKNSKALRSGVERINPNLREIGIFITFLGKTGSNARYGASLTVEYICKQTSQPSQGYAENRVKPNLLDNCGSDRFGDGAGDVMPQANGNIAETSPRLNSALSISCDVSDVGDVTKRTVSGAAI